MLPALSEKPQVSFIILRGVLSAQALRNTSSLGAKTHALVRSPVTHPWPAQISAHELRLILSDSNNSCVT